MTTTNLKYFQLLAQLEKNPLRPKVVGAFDVAFDFANYMQRIEADKRLSRRADAMPQMALCARPFATCAILKSRSMNFAARLQR
jgi:hypothetical protein